LIQSSPGSKLNPNPSKINPDSNLSIPSPGRIKSQKSFNTALIPDFQERNQETTTEDQQRSLEMFPDFNRPRDPHHHSHPFKHKPTPCPSDRELSPPYPSLYKHHHLPYLILTQNKQHQGEDTKYWKFHPLFLMNEYWKFLQFLLHPSLLSFNLLHA
jgi:hypothetical protein